MMECNQPDCIVKGALNTCRLCKKPACIQHMEAVRDRMVPGGVAHECKTCFGKAEGSLSEFAVYW